MRPFWRFGDMSRDHTPDSRKPNLPNAIPLLRFKIVQFIAGPAYPVGNRVIETRDHRGGQPTAIDTAVYVVIRPNDQIGHAKPTIAGLQIGNTDSCVTIQVYSVTEDELLN